MTRRNRLLAAGALALLLAGCDDAQRTKGAEQGGEPAGTAESPGEQIQRTFDGAVQTTREAIRNAGSTVQETVENIDTGDVADGIRAVGRGLEETGRAAAELSERAAARIEGTAAAEANGTEESLDTDEASGTEEPPATDEARQ